MRRRRLLRLGTVAAVGALAGCQGEGREEPGSDPSKTDETRTTTTTTTRTTTSTETTTTPTSTPDPEDYLFRPREEGWISENLSDYDRVLESHSVSKQDGIKFVDDFLENDRSDLEGHYPEIWHAATEYMKGQDVIRDGRGRTTWEENSVRVGALASAYLQEVEGIDADEYIGGPVGYTDTEDGNVIGGYELVIPNEDFHMVLQTTGVTMTHDEYDTNAESFRSTGNWTGHPEYGDPMDSNSKYASGLNLEAIRKTFDFGSEPDASEVLAENLARAADPYLSRNRDGGYGENKDSEDAQNIESVGDDFLRTIGNEPMDSESLETVKGFARGLNQPFRRAAAIPSKAIWEGYRRPEN